MHCKAKFGVLAFCNSMDKSAQASKHMCAVVRHCTQASSIGTIIDSVTTTFNLVFPDNAPYDLVQWSFSACHGAACLVF